MDVHKNARSVPASRVLLFKRVSEQGCSVHAASEAAGMSDRRCREWIRRAERDEPLTDRSSRPHSTTAISAETRTASSAGVNGGRIETQREALRMLY